MGGITALRKIQMGKETVPGEAVAAAMVWRGKGTLRDAREFGVAEEEIGQLVPKHRMYEKALLATLEMAEQEATFELLPYILAAGVEDVVTGVADGAGSGKIYEYNQGITSANAPRTFTIECGDNQRVDRMEYGFVTRFEVRGSVKDAWRFTANWNGRRATDSSFTNGLTPFAVEEIQFQNTRLFIDAAGGTIGQTQRTATFLGFTLTYETGQSPLFTGDGALFFTQVRTRAPKITGTLILEHDAVGAAELGYARARAVRLLRIRAAGSALATPGTNYSTKIAQFSAAIRYDSVPATADREGDQIVELPFTVVDSDSIVPTWIIVNEMAAVL